MESAMAPVQETKSKKRLVNDAKEKKTTNRESVAKSRPTRGKKSNKNPEEEQFEDAILKSQKVDPQKPAKTTRSRSTKKAPAPVVSSDEEKEELPVVPAGPKTSRSRKNVKQESKEKDTKKSTRASTRNKTTRTSKIDKEEPEEEIIVPEKPKGAKNTRGRNTKRSRMAAGLDALNEDAHENNTDVVIPEKEVKTKKRKLDETKEKKVTARSASTRGRPAKGKKEEIEVEEDHEASQPEEEPEPPKSKTTRGRSTKKTVAPKVLSNEEKEEAVPEEAPLKNSKSRKKVNEEPKEKEIKKSTRTSSRNKTTHSEKIVKEEEHEQPPTEAKATRARTTKRSRAAAGLDVHTEVIEESKNGDDKIEEPPVPEPEAKSKKRKVDQAKEKKVREVVPRVRSTKGRKTRKDADEKEEDDSNKVVENVLKDNDDETHGATPIAEVNKLKDKVEAVKTDLNVVAEVVESAIDQVVKTVDNLTNDVGDNLPKEATDEPFDLASNASLEANFDVNSVREPPDDDKLSLDDNPSEKAVDPVDEQIIASESSSHSSKDASDLTKATKIETDLENDSEAAEEYTNSIDKPHHHNIDDSALNETIPLSIAMDKRKAEVIESAASISSKKNRAQIIDVPKLASDAGKVMVFGEDLCGELGLKEIGISRKRPTFIEGIEEPVVSLSAGAMHTLCITSKGVVYSWGCNDEGALGRNTVMIGDKPPEAEPFPVCLPENVVKVSAGDSHSAALLESGSVYIWGNFKDSSGSIGLIHDSDKIKCVTSPKKLIFPDVIVDIASGSDHMLLLTESGEIFSFGVGEQGRLGRLQENEMKFRFDNREVFLKPQPVQFKEKLTFDRIWAGNFASFARTKTGQIYAWGVNNYSQLGFKSQVSKSPDAPSKEIFVPFAVLVPSFSKIEHPIVKISCGQHHSLALDSTGKIFSFGRHEYGRLGHGSGRHDFEEPTVIEALKEDVINDIAAGSVASFAVNDKGKIYSWGMSSAQLGLKNDDVWVPTQIVSSHLEKNKVIAVSAGSQHTVLIVKSEQD